MNLLYYSAFILLFYCLLITFFFGLVPLFVAIFMLIKGLFTCFKNFDWQLCAIKFILTFDNGIGAFVSLIAANWSYMIDAQIKADNNDGKYAERVSPEAE